MVETTSLPIKFGDATVAKCLISQTDGLAPPEVYRMHTDARAAYPELGPPKSDNVAPSTVGREKEMAIGDAAPARVARGLIEAQVYWDQCDSASVVRGYYAAESESEEILQPALKKTPHKFRAPRVTHARNVKFPGTSLNFLMHISATAYKRVQTSTSPPG